MHDLRKVEKTKKHSYIAETFWISLLPRTSIVNMSLSQVQLPVLRDAPKILVYKLLNQWWPMIMELGRLIHISKDVA